MLIKFLFLIANIVTTRKALVTRSDSRSSGGPSSVSRRTDPPHPNGYPRTPKPWAKRSCRVKRRTSDLFEIEERKREKEREGERERKKKDRITPHDKFYKFQLYMNITWETE